MRHPYFAGRRMVISYTVIAVKMGLRVIRLHPLTADKWQACRWVKQGVILFRIRI